jgi:hypothetical protein
VTARGQAFRVEQVVQAGTDTGLGNQFDRAVG